MKTIPEKKQLVFLVLTISGIIASIYWRVIFLPFISDDWWYLRQLQTLGNVEALAHFLNPNGKLVYRPLGEAFMILMYKIFGFDPVPMRWPSLVVHVVNSCLVVFIIDHLVENKWIGYLCGIVYASAIAVHLDIFAWAWATYYDIGGTLFFFLSIWMYLKERTWLSALLYLVGCLFKPTIIFLPGLLLLYSLVLPEGVKLELHPVRFINKWFYFLIFGGAVLGFKLIGGIPTTLGEDGPYYIDFWGKHLVTNAQKYLLWMSQAIFPFYSPNAITNKIISGISLSTILVASFVALVAIKQDKAFRRILLLTAWAVVGLLTVYFLPNHTFRYYTIYSLPAFAALFFYGVQYLFKWLKINQKIVSAVFFVFGLLAVVGSYHQSVRIFDEKLHQSIFADGSDMLIRRAATHTLVAEKLQKDFPSIPPGFVIVLVNIDLGSFGYNNSALQYLYGSDDFEVLPPSAVFYKNGDWFFNSADSDTQYLDPSLVVVYELMGNSIVRRDLFDLPQQIN